MPAFSSVLCAVDSSSLAPRVLRHAVGFAALCGARLSILTVTDGDRGRAERDVAELLDRVAPVDASSAAGPRIHAVRLGAGQVADVILELARDDVDLVVAGTHAAERPRWRLGSTSAALLEGAIGPTLLVPPGQLEIVTPGADAASLRPGTILAAFDLREPNAAQLRLASQLAVLARQPLALMTVAGLDMTSGEAEQALRARGQGLACMVEKFIVGRGAVAEEIDRVAVAERAGLVVIGLRPRSRRAPGETAAAVLKTKDAVVLAVPGF
jgi:nucleotide-binding universal stress UspA family protein